MSVTVTWNVISDAFTSTELVVPAAVKLVKASVVKGKRAHGSKKSSALHKSNLAGNHVLSGYAPALTLQARQGVFSCLAPG